MKNYVTVEDATSKLCGFISLSGDVLPSVLDGQTSYEVSKDTLDAVRTRDRKTTKVVWGPDEQELAFMEKDRTTLTTIAWADLRVERNQRLAASDRTVLPDFPGGKYDLWVAYRQELRDLPENTADPLYPVWPVLPG